MKTTPSSLIILLGLGMALAHPAFAGDITVPSAVPVSAILTPRPPQTPRINGPRIFGVRPGSPFLYAIPATGNRPIAFSAEGLPEGLRLDPATGRITGSLRSAGEFAVMLHAKNALGSDERPFRIVAGDRIALTPPMGWNSWNCWAVSVDQEKVLRSARAMVASGLARHGWTYINIDDTWQGKRGGPFDGIQADPVKFPGMKALCDEIHRLGLKAGIYSTPWTTSYAQRVGGSSENADGSWIPPTAAERENAHLIRNRNLLPWAVGKHSFAAQDARQWAAWGIDYLKYDWFPVHPPETRDMADALRASGRDVIYSVTNGTDPRGTADADRLSNCCMRQHATGDIRDRWKSITSNGLAEDSWAKLAGPGHWNDPDMLTVGYVGWGTNLHASRLSPDEQYSHISLWCLLSAPLLLGCDLDRLDEFTLGLLTNDEVLAIDQDPLGRQATRIRDSGSELVYAKKLEDGSWAVGLFNQGMETAVVTVKWPDIGVSDGQKVRDLWRQKELGTYVDGFSMSVAPHGVMLIRVAP